MTDTPVSASAAAHILAMQAVAGVPVQYVQDGTPSSMVAVPGRTTYAPSGAMGELFAVTKPLDWIIRTADLPAMPKSGDTIVSGGHTYDIVPVGQYRWYSRMDPDEHLIRLHSVRVDFPHSATLQKWTETGTDSHGQTIGTWGTDEAAIPCAIVPLGENNAEIARALFETASHRVFMRYRAAVTTRKRLLYDGRYLHIDDRQEIDEMGLFLVLTCTEDMAP